MFSRLIPNWDELNNQKQPLTEGERALLEYLDAYLPKDENFSEKEKLTDYKGWLIFAQPYLNGNRPDIIVFNPFVGIHIIEVKDWYLSHYFVKNIQPEESHKYELYVTDSRGSYPVKSPLRQVEFYKELIIGQLIPKIGDGLNIDSSKYSLIKTGVYFHNADTKSAKEKLEKLKKNLYSYEIIGRDYLKDKKYLKSIIPASQNRKLNPWNREWNDEIIFWLKPPLHSLEQGIPIKLTNFQKKIAEPSSGHHKIRGVAGSGKTLVLAYRAAKLASMGYRVLILTFNITLWHYIRDNIQRAPFTFKWDQFKFNHFHGFCKEILNKAGEKWPEGAGEEIFRTIIVQKVLNTRSLIEYEQYDAILIDEGQDYYIEWYQMLLEFITDRNEVVVCCDKKQNIYKREFEWLDTAKSNFGKWNELKIPFRLPNPIVDIANRFATEFNLNQELQTEQNPNQIELFSHYVWQNIDKTKWMKKIYAAYKTLTGKENIHPSDIVILLNDHRGGIECVEFFEAQNIKINHVFESDNIEGKYNHKKTFWMGDSRLKMSTIHSFKGWELDSIIICIPEKVKWEDEVLDALLYTAMTRTKNNLIVFNMNSRYAKFGNNLPNSWDSFNK